MMSMDKMIGPMYEKGLIKLKNVIENMKPSEPEIAIQEIQWDEISFVGTDKTTITMDKIAPFFAENMPKIYGELQKANLKSPMAPCSIYYDWNMDRKETTLAAVACLEDGKNNKIKTITMHNFPACKVLYLKYLGGYSGLPAAHMALGKYMADKGMSNNCVVEEYLSDPMSEKDSTKWITNIFYLLK